jgi:hypothetical protein
MQVLDIMNEYFTFISYQGEKIILSPYNGEEIMLMVVKKNLDIETPSEFIDELSQFISFAEILQVWCFTQGEVFLIPEKEKMDYWGEIEERIVFHVDNF